MFIREDWKLFGNIDTLCQKAGVTRHKIPSLVVKELVDNALDVADQVSVKLENAHTVSVYDDGYGISEEDLPVFFSINRPLVSSKLLRLPMRGALGNGLRVVTGAVIAFGGAITVETRGKIYRIITKANGKSDIEVIGIRDDIIGTRVIVDFGFELAEDVLAWGQNAIAFSQGKKYQGKTSAYWYTSEAFYDLCNAYQGTLRELVEYFHGVNKIMAVNFADYFGGDMETSEMSFEQTEELMKLLREFTGRVDKKKIGLIGSFGEASHYDYRKCYGEYTAYSTKGKHHATIPYTAEVWAELSDDNHHRFSVSVNRTPITGEVEISYYGANEIGIYGCGFRGYLKGRKANMFINLITPYMPITSDGKEPDFSYFNGDIMKIAQRTMQKAKRTYQLKKTATLISRDVIFSYMEEAIDTVSGNGKHVFSQRQLYYQIRPHVISVLDKGLEYTYFCRVLTEYENTYGKINGLYRDPRGSLYHPHLGTELPLGTQQVDEYERPSWTFNKVLYIEKRGLFPQLIDSKFPERFDCALVTSQGHASRAVKDLFDLLGDSDEEIQFFVIHDADAAGTMIYQTLQDETLSRPRRRVKIINLGLEPWEAVEMGLQVEEIKRKNNSTTKLPVARYLYERSDAREWREWMQHNRIELNAMSTPEFLEWLEGKMEKYGAGKIVPPDYVLFDKLKERIAEDTKNQLIKRILNESNFEDLLEKEIAKNETEGSIMIGNLQERVAEELANNPVDSWKNPISRIAREIVDK